MVNAPVMTTGEVISLFRLLLQFLFVDFVHLLGARRSWKSCFQDDIRLHISYMVILLENKYILPEFATSCYWLNLELSLSISITSWAKRPPE